MKRDSAFRYQQKPYSRCTSSKASESKLTSVLKSKLSSLKSRYKREINDHEIVQNRRQNYLNSFFNIRRNRLMQITKQNKKIYKRINEQKSYYSSRNLSRSYQSSCSNSRHSISSSSRRKGTPSKSRKNSMNSNGLKNQLNNCEKKASSLVTIQAQNIQKVNAKNIATFATMFSNRNSKQNTKNLQTRKKSVKPKQIFPSKSSKVQKFFPNLKKNTVLHKIVQEMVLNPFDKRKKMFY